MNGNGRVRVDYTGKDFNTLLEGMLALAREHLTEWTDQSPNDPGVVLLEAVAHAVDTQLYYVDRLLNESFLDTAVEDKSIVNLLRLIGYELRPPKAASAALTLLFDKAATGTVVIPTNALFETSAKVTGTPIPFRYVRPPLTVNVGALSLTSPDKKVEYRTLTGLPVVQVDAVVTETLGSSDASPGQRFRLAQKPLLQGSLHVFVDEGAGPREYEVRESLLNSGPTDRHVAVRRDELDVAWVECGNSRFGVIPPRRRNNISANYLVGGGAKGNVPAASILTAVTSFSSDLKKVTNPKEATGGSEREPIADAVVRAPRQFRSMGRAVTAADLENHALAFGVGKARAKAANWNRIELYVAPAGGGYPTDTLKDDLAAYFETRRILTSLLEILDPKYVGVEVRGMLEVEPYFFRKQVVTGVQEAVKRLLAFDAVSFEDTLYLSKVYEAIEAVDGVHAVSITRFQREDIALPHIADKGKLSFAWQEIPINAYDSGLSFEPDEASGVTGGLV